MNSNIFVPAKLRSRIMPTVTLLFCSQLGCDAFAVPQETEMQAEPEIRPSIVIELGKPMPPLPEELDVRRSLNDVTGGTIAIKSPYQITVVTYEGRRFSAPAEHVNVFLSKQGRVTTPYIWVLPRPMPWKEALAWFKDWLKRNKIEPNENLQKKLEIWSNNDFPGNELPRHEPRQDVSGTDLTATSALGIRWKPHPERDWILVLGVGLTAEEMGELRKKEAAKERQVDEKEDEDRPEDALDKFQRWHETHGEIDIEKLLNDDDYGPFQSSE